MKSEALHSVKHPPNSQLLDAVSALMAVVEHNSSPPWSHNRTLLVNTPQWSDLFSAWKAELLKLSSTHET